MLGRQSSRDSQSVLTFRRPVVCHTNLAQHSRTLCVSKGRDGDRTRRTIEGITRVVSDHDTSDQTPVARTENQQVSTFAIRKLVKAAPD
ncbi:MAG: hypothetical protein M3022_05065 [Actinomycetota bacterium]|nr:hypothetical protein [Actinomycetota bacterium]